MKRIAGALAVIVAGTLAHMASLACGPACIDDRCSLKAPKAQTTKVDYTKRSSDGGSSTAITTPNPTPGSAAPVARGSATPTPPPPTGGSAVVNAGSAGSAAPPVAPPPTPLAATGWQLFSGDAFKMHVISKGTYPAGTSVKFEIVKTPAKTPFVITLLVRAADGSNASEGVWNDCPEGKIKCDGGGTKTHALKKPGQILFAGGINWTVTGVTDDGKGTLVTWTNNLSREVLSLRILK